MRRLAVLMVAVTGLVVGGAEPCLACTCAANTPKGHAEAADVIFTGRVATVERRMETDPSIGFQTEFLVVELRVETAYKGPVEERMTVRTPTDSAACGFVFADKGRYTVFADDQGGQLHTGLCNATTPGHIVPARFGVKEQPVSPLSAEAEPEGIGGTPGALWKWLAAAAAVGVLAGLLLFAPRGEEVSPE